MYFVISVFPISMTSGAFPPASVASNFARCCVHCWYWTLTFTPGWSFSNRAFVEATRSDQPFWASVWSHTVRVVAALPPDAPVAPTATTASAATSTAAARARTFIRILRGILVLDVAVPVSVAVHGRSAQVVCTNLPRAGGFHILGPLSREYRSMIAA